MNGESKQLYNKLKEDFTDLKATVRERWNSHDKRSEEMWGMMTKDLAKIFTWLEHLRCDSHDQLIKRVAADNAKLWGLFWGLLITMVGLAWRIFIS